MRTTGPSQAPLLLLDVIDVLRQAGVRYMVVGAIAAAYHGVIRASRDADAVISLPAANLPALADKLRALGLEVQDGRGAADDPIARVLLLTDAHGNTVDLLWGVRGMERNAFERSRTTSLFDTSVNIVGPEDFIAMKLAAGGPRDLGDVEGGLGASGRLPPVMTLTQATSSSRSSPRATLGGREGGGRPDPPDRPRCPDSRPMLTILPLTRSVRAPKIRAGNRADAREVAMSVHHRGLAALAVSAVEADPWLSETQLPRRCHVHRHTLNRAFRAVTGGPFRVWRDGGRERQALALLTGRPELTIKEIAVACGFSGSGPLRAFLRRRSGFTATQIRAEANPARNSEPRAKSQEPRAKSQERDP